MRYPNIKVVVAHFGGAFPMLLHQLDHEAPPRVPGLLEACARPAVRSAKHLVNDLRSASEGLTPTALATAVPPVDGWRDTGLPALLAASDVTALLDSCDRAHPTGRRDFAILMRLARLGLRAAEVADLELGSVDWRQESWSSEARVAASTICRSTSTTTPSSRASSSSVHTGPGGGGTVCVYQRIQELVPWVMTNSVSSRTVTVGLTRMLGEDVFYWGQMMAGALITALPPVIMYTLAQRFVIKGLVVGGAKG